MYSIHLDHLAIVEAREFNSYSHSVVTILRIKSVVRVVQQHPIRRDIVANQKVSLTHECDLSQRETNRLVASDQKNGSVLGISRIADVIVDCTAISLVDGDARC